MYVDIFQHQTNAEHIMHTKDKTKRIIQTKQKNKQKNSKTSHQNRAN